MTSSQLDDPIQITNNAELAEQSSSGVGTRSDPYIIEDKMIDSAYSIQVSGTSAFFVIRDSEFVHYPGTRPVIEFVNVENGIIENCYVRGGNVGISFRDVTDCSIINCVTYDAFDGILIDNSNNCTVANCSIFGNTYGVISVNADYCDIINNSLYSNTNIGLQLEPFCENNTVAGNNFGWNRFMNLADYGANNVFDDGVVGNAWSDYNSSEDYIIPGTGGSTDFFATLLTDTVNPTLFGRLDTVVDVESNEEVLTWMATDDFHYQYHISIDGDLVEDGMWDGRPITYDVSNLGVGTYFVNITVIDAVGNADTDEVTVSVISFILGGIGTELVMIASGVTVVCFVVIILIIKRLP